MKMTRLAVFFVLVVVVAVFGINGGRSNDNSKHIGSRQRRGFRSYFYNYYDEVALSICSAISTRAEQIYPVRRPSNDTETCKDICEDPQLKSQAPSELQSLTWACSESIHVYKNQPSLADNYDSEVDSKKLGLAVYRYHSCTVGGSGPNYCCCNVY